MFKNVPYLWQVRYEGKRSAGDVAVYTCNFFFQLPAGDNGIRKCDLTGRWSPTSNWSGTDPVCVTVFTTVTYVCIVLATFTVFSLIGEPQAKCNRVFQNALLALKAYERDSKIN